MFYAFRQNNSGGMFIGTKLHIIEANSAEEANTLASNYDIYFDGCSSGKDCSCCGDRWERAYEKGGTIKPQYYKVIFEGTKEDIINSSPENFEHDRLDYTVEVHYKSGSTISYQFT